MDFFQKHKQALIALMIAVLLFLTIYASEDDEEASQGLLHQMVSVVANPIEEFIVFTIDGVVSIYQGYFGLVDAKSELGLQRVENQRLLLELNEMAHVQRENERLRRLLGFKRRVPLFYLPARIISSDILGQFRTVTINVGQKAGVRQSYPVVDASGVIGRIVEVEPSYSKVLLMIDPNSSIDGRIERTGARGIIQGRNDKDSILCQFAFSLRTEDVRVGDEIITSGLGQQFPAGLLLGTVVQVSKREVGIFQEATIKPTVDFGRLREVLVVLPGGNHQ